MSDDAGGADELAAFRARLSDARRALAERLAVEPRAYSADGQTFGFVAPLASAIPLGAFVRLRAATGAEYLGQVTSKEVAERDGPELTVGGDAGIGPELAGVRIKETSFKVRLQHVAGGGALLGRTTAEAVVPVAPADAFGEATIEEADVATVERYLRGRRGGYATLDIGTLPVGDQSARLSLSAAGFDRHTCLCGQSGSGKTYALGVILERLLLETDLPLIILDPNSDFVRLGEARPSPEETTAGNDARDRYLAATAGLRVLRPLHRGTTSPDALRSRFSNFTPEVQGMVLRLDPLADREEFNTFWSIVERFGDRSYSLADLRAAAAADLSEGARRLALRIANLGVAGWDVWADADEPALAGIADNDWRALVFDIAGFGNPAEKSLVAMAVLNFIWSRREERRPVLVVIDEAHNVCPQEPTDRLQAAATERAIQIAGEGRKYGIYLLLSTQRPQKLHANVLSQCDNLVLMRMNSAADLAHLAATFSFVPTSLLERASYFRQGESLIAGKVVPSPLFARFGSRFSREGGGDLSTAWAAPR